MTITDRRRDGGRGFKVLNVRVVPKILQNGALNDPE
jgi:hypothetical protein